MSENQLDAAPVELAGWKARLLDRIEELSARHARVLGTEYPGYREGDGRGAAAIEGWRGRLRDLEDSRTELDIRTELAGVDLELIELARVGGEQGEHWRHLMHRPAPLGEDDHGRAPLLDAIAESMWTLEHMAAIEAARHASARDFVPAPAAQQQFERNMTSLWVRVNTVAAVAQLTEIEQAEMLHRDPGNWIRLLARTVHRYTATGIEVRWRAYAWPGIEWDADRRSAEHVGAVRFLEPGSRAPAPDVLISRAAQALQVDIDEARVEAFIYGEDVLDHLAPSAGRFSDCAGAGSWGSEPAGESLARPPEFGTATDPA
ncbi:hypothetical protein ACFYO1_02840 [Nocardia sp. NPDC006044]|uniref:hypothetical protein n=1 Tax=Nocardia sp. NPDC006044 TaxID=3364306 RepID=UPI0036745504